MYAEIERLLIEDAPFLFMGVELRSTYISSTLAELRLGAGALELLGSVLEGVMASR
jgi:hypothetical protein